MGFFNLKHFSIENLSTPPPHTSPKASPTSLSFIKFNLDDYPYYSKNLTHVDFPNVTHNTQLSQIK